MTFMKGLSKVLNSKSFRSTNHNEQGLSKILEYDACNLHLTARFLSREIFSCARVSTVDLNWIIFPASSLAQPTTS